MGSDSSLIDAGRVGQRFNSRSRVGSDFRGWSDCPSRAVSIHAPAWGATEEGVPLVAHGRVSIHAPAWGATRPDAHAIRRIGVSIHAPAWGATHFSSHACIIPWVSIHAPAWGATGLPHSLGPLASVSIHAPAWGATFGATGRRSQAFCFNSRSRVGSDFCAALSRAGVLMFQFTLPRGERLDKGFTMVFRDVSIHAPAWGATSV